VFKSLYLVKNISMRYILLFLFLYSFHKASAQQIPPYIPTEALVGWWPFNGNAKDESGNGSDGVVSGATLATDRFGLSNACYSFRTEQDDKITGNLQAPLSNTHTYAFWAKHKTGSVPLKQWVFGTGTPEVTKAVHFGVVANIVRMGSWGADGIGTSATISTSWVTGGSGNGVVRRFIKQ
ncbi:MAG: hypothetical protein ACKO3B_05545, partial [Bacteroidota bacterium]